MLTRPPTFCQGSRSASASADAVALCSTVRSARRGGVAPCARPAEQSEPLSERRSELNCGVARSHRVRRSGRVAQGSFVSRSMHPVAAHNLLRQSHTKALSGHDFTSNGFRLPMPKQLRTKRALRASAGVHCHLVAPGQTPRLLHSAA